MVLVDSNVLLDVFDETSAWFDWSAEQLRVQAERNHLGINPIIYAEVSVRFASADALDAMLPGDLYERLSLPYHAAYLAGQAFVRYRRQGGNKSAPLPDFYIGAHALIEDFTLLTRDPARYRTHFPSVKLIVPS